MELNISGVRIRIGFSFFWLLAILLCYDYAGEIRLTLLFSVLHEAGHLSAIILCKQRPKQICFGLFGMTIVRDNDTERNYSQEIITALAGPFANIILCSLFYCFFSVFHAQTFLKPCMVNAAIAAFNLMPVFSLDGGKALECFLKKHFDHAKSESILKTVSLFFILILDGLGICILIHSRYNFTLLLVALYLTVLLFKKC